jgi:hypothetical protein
MTPEVTSLPPVFNDGRDNIRAYIMSLDTESRVYISSNPVEAIAASFALEADTS